MMLDGLASLVIDLLGGQDAAAGALACPILPLPHTQASSSSSVMMMMMAVRGKVNYLYFQCLIAPKSCSTLALAMLKAVADASINLPR
jgi:hypothetical protein